MNPEHLKQSAAYDYTTDQIKNVPFTPSSIMKIAIRRDQGNIDPREFYEKIHGVK